MNDEQLMRKMDLLSRKALITWDYDSQLRQVVEEANELGVAVCKLARHKTCETGIDSEKRIVVDDKYRHAAMEEMADMEVMLNQLKIMLGVIAGTLEAYEYLGIVSKKLEKLAVEIEEAE